MALFIIYSVRKREAIFANNRLSKTHKKVKVTHCHFDFFMR
jgi:hypothetical protein